MYSTALFLEQHSSLLHASLCVVSGIYCEKLRAEGNWGIFFSTALLCKMYQPKAQQVLLQAMNF
jgi:hypothetical protein